MFFLLRILCLLIVNQCVIICQKLFFAARGVGDAFPDSVSHRISHVEPHLTSRPESIPFSLPASRPEPHVVSRTDATTESIIELRVAHSGFDEFVYAIVRAGDAYAGCGSHAT